MNTTTIIVLCLTLPCLMTTIGASFIFFMHKQSRLASMITIGLAAGIMLSASIWSLLIPALEYSKTTFGDLSFLPLLLGFVFGALLMILLDFLCTRLLKKRKIWQKALKNHQKIRIYSNFCNGQINYLQNPQQKENQKIAKNKLQQQINQPYSTLQTEKFSVLNNTTCSARKRKKRLLLDSNKKQKAFKLFTAITIHNIPEGLSVGFAIGTAIAMNTSQMAAFMFALGIALQNLPEGLATALPMQNCIHNRGKSFLLATLSGVVEPVFAVIGYLLAAHITFLLPYLLAFSAGAMIYVIIEEMIPEIHMEDGKSFGTWAFVLGFLIMMILDICL